MLRKGTLHAREPEALMDGSFRAVTLSNAPPYGVMAWAGRLRSSAKEKAAAEIDVSDFESAEKVSFCRWADVWEYFAEREYADLVARLRSEVEGLYPRE